MSRTTTRSTHSELSVDDELDSLEKLLVAQTVYEFGRGAWPTIAQLLTEHPSLVRPKGSFTPRVSLFAYLLSFVLKYAYLWAPLVMPSNPFPSYGGSWPRVVSLRHSPEMSASAQAGSSQLRGR